MTAESTTKITKISTHKNYLLYGMHFCVIKCASEGSWRREEGSQGYDGVYSVFWLGQGSCK